MSTLAVRNRYFDDLFNTPDLAWMGQNTNHIPAHPAVTAAMIESITKGEFNAYAPPLGFEDLRAAIVDDFGVPGLEALVTEGGVNALSLVCRARAKPGTTLVTTDPTWKWPCLFAEQQGAEVVQTPIYGPETNYKLTPEMLRAHIDERCAIVYVVDPNNPLGVTYSAEEIAAFAAIAKEHGALLVHDCTYRDFADGHTPAISVDTENCICTFSFSKWLGLAGMRIGGILASPELIAEFAAASTSVLGGSVVAQRGALAGLKVKAEWMAQVRRIDQANKVKIKDAAEALGMSVPVWPSHGNFLVIEIAGCGATPEAIVEAARLDGVMIRQGAYHTEAFGSRFIKVSTTVPEAWADKLAAKLADYVQTAKGLTDVPALF
ncbi:pyridoxal phosphate-dependent aminotransferase [Alloyangia pacifica]|uniref:Aminotransferase n=1 Tax=Alloyangia pacifica TaxID=311180 RepID=A0A1I6UY82_9RHOB|nr:pyridoxal phosphate-dependent aminotransferase [Alloyangia pacifica]SDI30415.1 Aspartate/methionine/tyrosine aminotransferase [Alloyangia pacifica]SFT06386.1 Aspartate/methionine/tyrosine aminotransferase [Alloyangia pacifica]